MISTAWTGSRLIQTAILVAAVFAFAQPSAQAKFILNLTTGSGNYNEQAALGGDFYATNTQTQPTGTGVIDSFLRIQQTGQERGYNTSVGKNKDIPLDDVPPVAGFTRAIQLKDIPLVQINGSQYYEFLLDVNQVSNGNISLNQVQIFASNADVGNTYSSLTEADSTHNASITFDASAAATKVFQMSADSWATASTLATDKQYEAQILSDSGSGSGDMFLYVNANAFNGYGSNTYVTLFSQFGNPNGTYSSNAGFEEWAVLKGNTGGQLPVPAPPTAILALMGLPGFVAMAWARRRRVVMA